MTLDRYTPSLNLHPEMPIHVPVVSALDLEEAAAAMRAAAISAMHATRSGSLSIKS
jgi:hypothetical protein